MQAATAATGGWGRTSRPTSPPSGRSRNNCRRARPTSSRCAARSTWAPAPSRRSTRPPGRSRRAPLHQPRNSAAGSLRQKDPKVTAARALDLDLPARRGGQGPPLHQAPRDARLPQVRRPAGQPRDHGAAEPRGGADVLRAVGAAPPRPRLRDRRRGREGRRPRSAGRARLHGARRGGPSPTSSARGADRKLLDILVSVGADRPSHPYARLDPCSSAAPTWARRPCTTRTRCRAKDVLKPGDTVIVHRAGDVFPEVVGPVLADRPNAPSPGRSRASLPLLRESTLVRPEGERHPLRRPPVPGTRSTARSSAASRGRSTSRASASARCGSSWSSGSSTTSATCSRSTGTRCAGSRVR